MIQENPSSQASIHGIFELALMELFLEDGSGFSLVAG